ncbi:MAG: hypothetical protein QOH95_1844 [Gaiellaceae bacterium]|jgi:hypothetical protein|nr:hypothetical protein [Gaiellaceae bacterium]
MEGQTVVTSDDHKLGTILAERDDCVIIETGHIFKAKHAIPREFLHEVDGQLRATLTKDVVDDSPKVDLENWDCSTIKLHYGLDGPFEVDPDPDSLENAETDAARAGMKPAPAERIDVLEGNDANTVPVIRDRMANAADPAGVTANLSNENRTGGGEN